MKDEIQQERTWAVQRFLNGEKPESICVSLCRSKAWLYKWVERHITDDNSWSESQSRRPLSVTSRTPKEIEEIVKNAQIIDSTKSAGVNIGDEVTVNKNGKEENFSIVGEFEADPTKKKLSATSPIGKALIGKKEGDKVAIDVPAGKLEYTILKIVK